MDQGGLFLGRFCDDDCDILILKVELICVLNMILVKPSQYENVRLATLKSHNLPPYIKLWDVFIAFSELLCSLKYFRTLKRSNLFDFEVYDSL